MLRNRYCLHSGPGMPNKSTASSYRSDGVKCTLHCCSFCVALVALPCVLMNVCEAYSTAQEASVAVSTDEETLVALVTTGASSLGGRICSLHCWWGKVSILGEVGVVFILRNTVCEKCCVVAYASNTTGLIVRIQLAVCLQKTK